MLLAVTNISGSDLVVGNIKFAKGQTKQIDDINPFLVAAHGRGKISIASSAGAMTSFGLSSLDFSAIAQYDPTTDVISNWADDDDVVLRGNIAIIVRRLRNLENTLAARLSDIDRP